MKSLFGHKIYKKKCKFAQTNNQFIYVYITGSNEARTRLYRMGISKYFGEISEDFEVRGLQNNAWKPFKPNGNYKAFLVNRKLL